MSAELKHTPGPWTVTKHIKAYEQGDNDYPGAEISFYEWDGKQWHQSAIEVYSESAEQDANLIAASPDLLEAIKGLVKRHTELVDSGDCGCWDVHTELAMIAALKAIDKAEGR